MKKRMLSRLMLLLAIVSMSSLTGISENSKTLHVPLEMSINGTLISPGRYQFTWKTHSHGVTVTLTQAKKVVVTVEGTLVDRDIKYNRNAMVCTFRSDGTRVLVELRLGSEKKAIIFDQ